MKIFTFICFNTIISQYYINTRNTDSWYTKRTDLISNFEIMAKLNVSFLLYLKIPSRACLTRSKVRHCLYDSFLLWKIVSDSTKVGKHWLKSKIGPMPSPNGFNIRNNILSVNSIWCLLVLQLNGKYTLVEKRDRRPTNYKQFFGLTNIHGTVIIFCVRWASNME